MIEIIIFKTVIVIVYINKYIKYILLSLKY